MKPKVLSLVWYKVLPPLFGGQRGIALFNHYLAEQVELTCLCSRDNTTDTPLPYRLKPILPTGQKQVLNPLYWRKVTQQVRREQVGAIILEHPYHGLAAWLAAKASGARLIVHSHNIESERFRQLGKWWWPLLSRYEKWVHRRAALNIFKTEKDRDFALMHFRLSPDRCLVVPYGVEKPAPPSGQALPVRQQYGIKPDEKLLLFAGTLDYEPNAAAVEDIYRELLPRLQKTRQPFRIIICGRNRFPAFQYLNELADSQVIMAGEVTQIQPYFEAADVFINPVLAGGGIQTKNLDALAQGCNTVCFSAQATGIPLSLCGDKLSVAEDGNWEAFSAHTLTAMNRQLPLPEAFFSYFDWNRLLQPLIHNLQEHD